MSPTIRDAAVKHKAAPLAAHGGIEFQSSNRDSFRAFLELMEVVEALCPRWPERNRITTGEFLL